MKNKNKTIMWLSLCAAFAIMVAGLATARQTVKKYASLAGSDYQRSLYGLAESAENINSLLEKGLCVSSQRQFASIAARLEAESEKSKLLLGQLPISEGRLENVSRFYSQAGNYAMAISGRDVSDEDRQRLSELFKSSESLRVALEEIIARTDSSGWADELVKLDASIEQGGSFSGLDDTDEGFTGYASLVYDGAFSDHIYERKPLALEGREQVTQEQALEKAEKITSGKLSYSGKGEGVIPSYIFSGDGVEVSVCPAGGDIVYMVDSSERGKSALTAAEAEKQAADFVSSCGYDGMERVSFMTDDNACTFNFARAEDGIIYYPDQVKATVSLANGDIVGFDTRDYIMNRHDRSLPSPSKTESEAREKVSGRLTVKSSRLAVIMTEGMNEKLCYEFDCESPEGTRVLAYINADDLNEENVLIVHETPYGISAE